MKDTQILLKPIITEKSVQDARVGIFTFVVGRASDKLSIRKAVESQFGVHTKGVQTIKMTGKKRLVGRRRTKVAEANWKKAKVQLKSGEKIDLFETEGAKS